MKKINQLLSVVAVTALGAAITFAAAPAGRGPGGPGGAGGPPGMGAGGPPGGGRGGFGGGGARGGGGGRGNSGDIVPSTNPTAKSLSKPTTPTAKPDENGFIRRWSILEPIYGTGPNSQNALRESVKKEYFPGQMTVIPKDGDKVKVGEQELTWRQLESKNFNVNLIHFANDLGINSTNDALVWVVAVVNVPEEVKDARLAIGSNDGSSWWVNGEFACDIFGDILGYPDDAVSKRLTLKKGANVIRGAVHNSRGQTDFCARLLDKNGDPIKDYTISLTMP